MPNNHEQWESDIDFNIIYDIAVELTEFKEYIRLNPIDGSQSMVKTFKAWLWNKGIVTYKQPDEHHDNG